MLEVKPKRKTIQKSISIFIVNFLILKCFCQSINLTDQTVKFSIGDNMNYAVPAFDDSKWQNIHLAGNWEKQGYEHYDGYAWYRMKIVLPSSIKKEVMENNGLVLSLGAIDDADETYFNGKKIGNTGGFPPDYFSKWNSKRNYRILPNEILFDKENTIAIRVYDAHQGGGMYEGPYFIAPASWANNMTLSIQSNGDSGIFEGNTVPEVFINLKNSTNKNFSGIVELLLKSDKNETLTVSNQSVELKIGEEKKIIYTPSFQKPGFYTVLARLGNTIDTDSVTSALVVGFNPTHLKILPDKKADFENFWSTTVKELKQTAPEFKILRSAEWSTAQLDVYLVEMKSFGNITVRGWYSVPKGKQNCPGLLRIPGHSVNILPDTTIYDFAVLALNIRGHGNSQDEINPGFPGYLTYGIEDKNTYIYRGAFMDCIRGVDFLCSRQEVDTSKLAVEGHSQGGGLTFVTAALDPRVKVAAADQPFLSDFKNYFEIVVWPRLEFQQYLYSHPSITPDKLFTTLSYFDIKNFAEKINCSLLMMTGLMDDICPPFTNFVAFNNLPSQSGNENKYIVYPQARHELPSGYYRLKLDWIRTILKI